ncbi:MAG: hypothetical protein L0J68_09480, partial [Micrococcaceae bacterium]|nr:hypothetical protein [Micrococcaceae bacterium]
GLRHTIESVAEKFAGNIRAHRWSFRGLLFRHDGGRQVCQRRYAWNRFSDSARHLRMTTI